MTSLFIDVETLNITEVAIDELSNQTVRQIYRNGSFLYVLTNKNIYESVDDGSSWSLFDRNGLPLDLYSITFPIASPLPGTELRRMAENNEYGMRINSNNWNEYISNDFEKMHSINMGFRIYLHKKNIVSRINLKVD